MDLEFPLKPLMLQCLKGNTYNAIHIPIESRPQFSAHW